MYHVLDRNLAGGKYVEMMTYNQIHNKCLRTPILYSYDYWMKRRTSWIYPISLNSDSKNVSVEFGYNLITADSIALVISAS